jgi:hypothetical protein
MRLATILAHVLASTTLVTSTLVACGGQTAGVSDKQGPSGSSGVTPGEDKNGTDPLPPVLPPVPEEPTDASAPDANPPDAAEDAGCTKGPVLVRQGGDCSDVWQQPCGIPKDVDPSDGMTQAECDKVCGPKGTPGQYWGCSAYLLADLPGPSFSCYTCVAGRRPQGYADAMLAPTVAGWLAHAADLERVSIDAFRILRRELLHHGAPSVLVERAIVAEADEVRHAHVLGELARRAGATVAGTPVHHGAARSLVDIALENAVEGCIRETYGALVAGFQAEHARRTDVRRVMKQIYRDETTHAELAWSVHAWIMSELSTTDRERVTNAMDSAITELGLAARSPTAPELVEALGLPRPQDAARLVDGLAAHLWSPALAA